MEVNEGVVVLGEMAFRVAELMGTVLVNIGQIEDTAARKVGHAEGLGSPAINLRVVEPDLSRSKAESEFGIPDGRGTVGTKPGVSGTIGGAGFANEVLRVAEIGVARGCGGRDVGGIDRDDLLVWSLRGGRVSKAVELASENNLVVGRLDD
jgi:hypothetical protein